MTNADKFKGIFGVYATELWAMPEKEFLEWLNDDVPDTNDGETISRQAAIRWVKTECNPYGKPTLDFESGKKVIEHLKQMPSAQPEIIRCKDCKWYGRADKRRFYRGMDCLQKRIDTIVPDKDFCSRAERRTDE